MEELLGQDEAVGADEEFVRRARKLLDRDSALLCRLAAGSPDDADPYAARPDDDPS